jgi:hypothetical protein
VHMERSGRRGSDDVVPFLLLHSLLSKFMAEMLRFIHVVNDGGRRYHTSIDLLRSVLVWPAGLAGNFTFRISRILHTNVKVID